ncbi:NUMOD4 motif-containing HNH endonuclease [Klebsiella pneumoniae]|uniref:NUMOD4 motif-containing HNH endonuclease n=1 Tax=Klebsiella pneumoniae TaxID=573 RepID=UPI00108420CF|nr:NUMOD4 motif-containing HNH endonuclease [Klebsiella pneumoniae]VGJ85909.1 NUMOD4 motif [Klebsiella pneumoniae]
MKEEWKVIEGYENYAVSSLGRIKRLTSNNNAVAGKVLKTFIATTGYPMVNLIGEKGRKMLSVHRLVAKAFIPKLPGCEEVNHIDSCRSNNAAENLEWVTASGNRLHAYRHGGLTAKGAKNGYSKLTEIAVLEIRRHPPLTRDMQEKLSAKFGVSMATIRDVAARRTWTHI